MENAGSAPQSKSRSKAKAPGLSDEQKAAIKVAFDDGLTGFKADEDKKRAEDIASEIGCTAERVKVSQSSPTEIRIMPLVSSSCDLRNYFNIAGSNANASLTG